MCCFQNNPHKATYEIGDKDAAILAWRVFDIGSGSTLYSIFKGTQWTAKGKYTQTAKARNGHKVKPDRDAGWGIYARTSKRASQGDRCGWNEILAKVKLWGRVLEFSHYEYYGSRAGYMAEHCQILELFPTVTLANRCRKQLKQIEQNGIVVNWPKSTLDKKGNC